jgi:uncharacterized membrane protein YvlD (DUF360 family)
VSPLRILATAVALPIVQLVVGGFRIGADLTAPKMMGTLLAVALLLGVLQAATAGPQRYLLAALPGPTLGVVGSLLLNGLVCWVAMAAASAAGLAVAASAYLPALCASLVIPIVAGLLETAAPVLWLELSRG